MTPDEARRLAYNALVAAGSSHDDALYVIRQMEAANGPEPDAETAGEVVALPSPSPAKGQRLPRRYGPKDTTPRRVGRPKRPRWPDDPKRFDHPEKLDHIDRWALALSVSGADGEEAVRATMARIPRA